ncbi:MAG: hypothetical protein FWG64_04680, partial [Firmicutes bacterium]|nr:hypothetical protein [Bacillota bacterium]
MQSKRVAGTAYHVYTNGKVTGMAGEILTGTTTKDGYIAYKLTIGNEKVQVLGHLLVAKAFLPPPRKNMV